MTEAGAALRFASGRHASLMLGAAGVMLLGLLLPAPRFGIWLGAVLGTFGSVVFAHFALLRRRAARAVAVATPSGQGRVRESPSPDSRAVFEFPAGDTEPWVADAFTLSVVTLALGWAAIVFGSESRLPAGLLAVMVGVLGLRAGSAPLDRVRLELLPRGWSVEAVVFGRAIRRSGRGDVLPELLSESLVLWSRDGRIGVLRCELEPEERAWLAERLVEHTRIASAAAPADDELDQRQPDEQGQQAERERHA